MVLLLALVHSLRIWISGMTALKASCNLILQPDALKRVVAGWFRRIPQPLKNVAKPLHENVRRFVMISAECAEKR
jgi:hypothetical protein